MHKRIILKTIVDITETGSRHMDGTVSSMQHQNMMTVINTIGLRTNPIEIRSYTVSDTPSLEFGTIYGTVDKFWVIEFTPEQEMSSTPELLTDDFNGVPFITGLAEVVKFQKPVFVTINKKYKNIVFSYSDK